MTSSSATTADAGVPPEGTGPPLDGVAGPGAATVVEVPLFAPAVAAPAVDVPVAAPAVVVLVDGCGTAAVVVVVGLGSLTVGGRVLGTT